MEDEMARWRKGAKCEMCRVKEGLFHYRGHRLCASCKSDMVSCDNQ